MGEGEIFFRKDLHLKVIDAWNELRKHGKYLYITRGVRREIHYIYLHLLCLLLLRGSGVMKPRRTPTDSSGGEVA